MQGVRCVVLYDRHKIRPETLHKIATAQNGEMIPVEPVEMAAFLPLAIYVPLTDEAIATVAAARRVREEQVAAKAPEPPPPPSGKEVAKAARDRVRDAQRKIEAAAEGDNDAALDELERLAAEADV